jgi:cytochrome c oxidase subunit 2
MWRPLLYPATALALASCNPVQSSLDPLGAEARRVASLFWTMTAGGVAITFLVTVLMAVALFAAPARRKALSSECVIIGGGLIFPVITLSALLIWGFLMLGSGPTLTVDKPLKVSVIGERWWWRVIYQDEAGSTIESANELRVPVGRPIKIELSSDNVIHSFWAPRLAGKLDMIPGRKTVLTLFVEQAGVSRGQCAEYCDGPHALMAFNVVSMSRAEYRSWWSKEAQVAHDPIESQTQQGKEIFLSSGCGACHTIRGTQAEGRLGPDLTHVGGRLSIAAATLAADQSSIARWVAHNQAIKPGNLMPEYKIFSESELFALSSYLSALR